MNPVLAALAAMTAMGGALLLIVALRPAPARVRGPRPTTTVWRRWWARRDDARSLILFGAVVGLVVFAVTGWFIAVVVVPLVAVGVPYLLAPKGSAGVDRLDAMAEWTRSLSGVLGVGVGLEQALIVSQRSTPEPIRDPVDNLVARLRARWATDAALRAFADDLDDATGDLIAAALILGARRRGAGLAAVLDGLAASVAAEVRVRRQIETDRAKPATTARWITLITMAVLGVLALNGSYMAPYSTPIGQLILAVLLAAYAGSLIWMRQVAAGRRLPRFLGARAAQEATR